MRLSMFGLLMMVALGCATPDCPKLDPCKASGAQDWNGDGVVNAEDFALFVRECGK